ncbi:MAG: flagellar motor protein MotA [Rhizobiaceae bacterium]
MAMAGSFDRDESIGGRYDPDRLSSPQIFLLTMLVFLAIAGFVAAILWRQIGRAFETNPGLNGLIVGVLAVGIGLAFLQVFRLLREVRWVNSFRAGIESPEPVLLAPMKVLLSRHTAASISTTSMRSLLDSIASRLDEARDITRYLTGLLVFLGLLGTFWGLLSTIGSIGETIRTLDPGSGEATDMLEALKTGLAAPLDGMGTAFSSSLFGLSGSLVLGFLDLQASRAQNRFYTELENWLSTVTDLGVDSGGEARVGSAEELRLLADRLRTLQDSGASSHRVAQAMASLAEGVSGLVKNMRTEQQTLRDFIETQAGEQKAMRGTLERLSSALERRDGNS